MNSPTKQKQKRHKTQAHTQSNLHPDSNIDRQLDKMLFLAAEQKLLPKIIYEYSYKHNSPKFANQYRESVKQIYTKQTATPLVYNEQQAKTHRQKFREKIMKLVNNELPIDYLRPVKVNGKYIMTYKGHPLEKVQYPTKSELVMFNDYSEAKFKKEIESIFDDKLEYAEREVLRNPRRELAGRTRTQPNVDIREKIVANKNTTAPVYQSDSKMTSKPPEQAFLPKLISARSQFDRARLLSPKLNIKKTPKKPKNVDQEVLILETMMKIGKYSKIEANSISVTKQSILKYFKQFYPRPHRIVDFLQFSDVQTHASFSKIPQKLKFMPNEHIYFMTFLFYDSNNDGYICSNDLLRLEEVGKRCPLLLEDHQIIRKGALKVRYENVLPYTDLYRLSQVTETTYFNWVKKEKDRESLANPEVDEHNEELKGYFEYLNKRKVMVHYEGFKKLFQNEKPNLYYDLVWRVSGVRYEGLKYQ